MRWRCHAGSHRFGRGAQYADHAPPPRRVLDSFRVSVPVFGPTGARGEDRKSEGVGIPPQLHCRNGSEVRLSTQILSRPNVVWQVLGTSSYRPTRSTALGVRERILQPGKVLDGFDVGCSFQRNGGGLCHAGTRRFRKRWDKRSSAICSVLTPPDAESEIWMMTGMAVRMSVDLGLHIVRAQWWSAEVTADRYRTLPMNPLFPRMTGG
jgi:hypothetical protein